MRTVRTVFDVLLIRLGSDKPCETLRKRVDQAILDEAEIGMSRLGVQNVSSSI